jgi:hypothetical protein
MRLFQPSGRRRENGFHAVMNTASRRACESSNRSISALRQPIRTMMPATE